jgi:ribosomal silencing factor RsfS
MDSIRDDVDTMFILKVSQRSQARKAVRNLTRELRSQGYEYKLDQDNNWTVLAVGGVLVHVFTPEWARYYRLEQLWGMCPAVRIA